MALSLNDVNEKKKKTAKKSASPLDEGKIQKKIQRHREKRQQVKPWQVSQAPKRERSQAAKEISLNEATESHQFTPSIENNWLFLENGSKSLNLILQQMDEAYYKLQKNSYWISKVTQTTDWVKSIKVYPKVKIPIPPIFVKRDKKRNTD